MMTFHAGEMIMARQITKQQMQAEGLVIVGEWGNGTPSTSGHIVCQPENRNAVQAAYDAIEDGDLGPDVLDAVIAAGGEHVVGL
jgi:hypothetical protein